LGIGANTAIFTVVNELLLRPLPFRNAEQLVMLWEKTPEGLGGGPTSRANFVGWRTQGDLFDGMAAFSDQRANLTDAGEPEEVTVQLATPDLFHILGVDPILGRTLTSDDAKPGSPVAVMSYGLWRRRYGGNAQILNQPIMLNGTPTNVVGVMPANFQWHITTKSGTGRPAELWTVLPMPTEGSAARGRFLSVVARLKPGVSVAQGEAQLKTIAARLAEDAPQFNKGWSAEVVSLRDQFVGNVRLALWIILGAVGLVLLIACANVANLLLSRAAAREKEMAVRAALGAGRLRIIRQLLTESLLLAMLGSFLGLTFAWFGIKALVAVSPRDFVNLQDVGLNLTVLAWTMAISVLTGVVFGLAPALEATRVNLNDGLKEGKGTDVHGPRSRRLRSALVVTEVALAIILLVSSGLLIRSFIRLRQIETGFNIDNTLTMVLRLPAKKYSEDRQVVSFFQQLTERVNSLPGVQSAGIVNYLPLYGGLGARTIFTIDGKPAPPPGRELELSTHVRVADPGYFKTMGIPLLRGRNFSQLETSQAKQVVPISDSLARKHFPGEDPIGKRISVMMFEKPNPTEIIGIVGDVRYEKLIEQPEPTAYFPHPELTYPFMTLVIRTDGDPAGLAPAVQREVRVLDPEQPISDVRTMIQVMAQTVARARFNTLLLTVFAGLATFLAAVGIFGVMNYTLSFRTREIGLRMALGAQQRQVRFLILKQGLVLTLIGMAVGVIAALALTRLMASLLFGVGAADPLTFLVILPLLLLVSLVACYLPARRATKIDPMIALRSE
jgi:putative ABC transport system permease protein